MEYESWVSVENRLPNVGQPVLCWPPKCFDGSPASYTVVLRSYKDKRWFVVVGNGIVYNHNPTHWMPLPGPPKNKTTGGE